MLTVDMMKINKISKTEADWEHFFSDDFTLTTLPSGMSASEYYDYITMQKRVQELLKLHSVMTNAFFNIFVPNDRFRFPSDKAEALDDSLDFLKALPNPLTVECFNAHKKNIFKHYMALLIVMRNYESLSPFVDSPHHALSFAAINGYASLIPDLADSSDNINSTNSAGRSALYFAVKNGHLKVVKTLIRSGADVNASHERSSYTTALHVACHKGDEAMVQYLLSVEANPNALEWGRHSPLMAAVDSCNENIVELLIKKGAYTQVKRVDGVLALDLAQCTKNSKIIQLLTDAQARHAVVPEPTLDIPGYPHSPSSPSSKSDISVKAQEKEDHSREHNNDVPAANTRQGQYTLYLSSRRSSSSDDDHAPTRSSKCQIQ